MSRNVNAIILAAGQGTRLRPYTDDRPKCMVELCGRPLLHHQLDVLRGAGVDNIVLVGGYRADQLDAPGTTLVQNARFAETNMVYTLFCADRAMVPGEDLVVSYGDIVYEPSVLEALLTCPAPLCIAVDREWRRLWELRMEDPLADAETLKLEDATRITELGKKPVSYDEVQGQYMGLIKIRGDYVRALRDAWHGMDRSATYDGMDFGSMYMTSFLQHLIDVGWEARAVLTNNGWLEVDSVEDLLRFERLDLRGELKHLWNSRDGSTRRT